MSLLHYLFLILEFGYLKIGFFAEMIVWAYLKLVYVPYKFALPFFIWKKFNIIFFFSKRIQQNNRLKGMLPIIRPKQIGPCPFGRPLPTTEEIIVVSSDDEDNEVLCEQTTRITEWRVTIIARQRNNHRLKETVPLKT